MLNLIIGNADIKYPLMTLLPETFEKCPFLFKFKEVENFNHPRGICYAPVK